MNGDPDVVRLLEEIRDNQDTMETQDDGTTVEQDTKLIDYTTSIEVIQTARNEVEVRVKDDGIDTSQIAGDAVTSAKVAANSIGSSELVDDSVTISSGDGLKNGGTVALGNTTTLDVEPSDFAGSGLQDDGVDNLELVNDTVTVAGNSVSLGGSTGIAYQDLTNTSSYPIPNSDLNNDSVTITGGDGIKNGGAVALGNSVTIDIDVSDFAGNVLSDDGSENLDVTLGNGVEDNTGSLRVDVSAISGDGLRNPDVNTVAVDVSDISGSGLQDDGSENLEIVNDTITVSSGDGLKNGGSVSLGSSITLNIEPSDFAGSGLQDDGTDDLELVNDSITLNGGDGLKNGSTASLGGSFSLDIEPADFAGAGLQDDGVDNLELVNDSITVSSGTALSGGGTVSLGGSTTINVASDGITTTELDLSITPTWTGKHQFDAGLDTRGDIEDNTTVIWDSSAGELKQSVLQNDSVTVSSGNALTGGGSVSLGGSITLDVGTSVIDTSELDLSISPTWTGSHTFNNNVSISGNQLQEVGGTTDASTGAIRLASGSNILWRNNADSADFGIETDASDDIIIDSGGSINIRDNNIDKAGTIETATIKDKDDGTVYDVGNDLAGGGGGGTDKTTAYFHGGLG